MKTKFKFGQTSFTRIKTFEDARLALANNSWVYQGLTESNDEYAYRQLKLIVRAINQG